MIALAERRAAEAAAAAGAAGPTAPPPAARRPRRPTSAASPRPCRASRRAAAVDRRHPSPPEPVRFPRRMTTLIFVLVWVVLGLGLLLIALSGGPSGAMQQVMSQTRAGARRRHRAVRAAGARARRAHPRGGDRRGLEPDDIPEANVTDLTASEKHGRELFGQRCANCHTLKAANAIAAVGPNLDELRPQQGARAQRDRERPRQRQRPDGGRPLHGPGRRGRRELRRQGRRPDRAAGGGEGEGGGGESGGEEGASGGGEASPAAHRRRADSASRTLHGYRSGRRTKC